MFNTFRQAIAIASLTATLAGCHTGDAHNQVNDITMQGDTVTVAATAGLSQRIRLMAVQPEQYRQRLLTTGTVKAIPTQYAEIAPPFPGRVLRSYIRLGMRVTPATPLFEISSADFMAAQKLYFQARSQYHLSQQTLKRQHDLFANGVTSRKDLDEAETAFEVAKKEYESGVAAIKTFNADPGRLILGQPLTVYSPIAGEVVDNRIIAGQFIRADAASLAIVAALSTVWVAGQVKEKDIRFLQQPDSCVITIPALPETIISGQIYHVSEIVDEATRSIPVLVACNNTQRTLKPGMYVTVQFMAPAAQALLIPATAILQAGNESYVFTAAGHGRYVRRRLAIAGSEGNRVIVTGGLQPGEQIVAEGGFYLSAAK